MVQHLATFRSCFVELKRQRERILRFLFLPFQVTNLESSQRSWINRRFRRGHLLRPLVLFNLLHGEASPGRLILVAFVADRSAGFLRQNRQMSLVLERHHQPSHVLQIWHEERL
uniref:(northern house mosquito) hypothetical protein n=1 Tax=Culex pipiens TaxID=7175 RepID=A0A8D8E5W9_CULPI